MNVFEKWNKNVNADFMKDLDAQENGQGGNFEKVPYDTYEVRIEKMEIKSSKNGDPMLSMQFKIVNGALKGRLIFMNQVILQPFQIHIANDFLRSLDCGLEIKFKDYAQYSDLVLDVAEAVSNQKLEYALEFGTNDKNYDTFKITEVFEAE